MFGVKRVRKEIGDGLHLRRQCGRCHYISDMQEYSFRPYFTFFFIPVVPVGKSETLLVCSRCEAAFYPQAENHQDHEGDGSFHQANAAQQEFPIEKTIITCVYCSGRLRVPVAQGRKLLVTCPHCSEKFDLELEDGV